MDLLQGVIAKINDYRHPSDFKVYRAKPHTGWNFTLARIGNSAAVIGVFVGIAVAINEPLRFELAKSLTPDIELANAEQSVNTWDIEEAPSMKPVSMGKANLGASPLGDVLISPEALRKPIPSIAPLAKQISGSIDPAAQDSRLMISKMDQQKVTNFMANKYRVDPKSISEYISHAIVVAKEVDLDPVLLVAVMAIESNFNPNVQSNMGAQGLMQVLTRVHSDKFAPYGGTAAAFKPEVNIRVGALILKSYIASSGSLQGGLRYYVGGATVGDGGYAAKVMQERENLIALLKNTQIREVPLEVSPSQFSKILPPPSNYNNKSDKAEDMSKAIPPIEYVEAKEHNS